MAEKVTTIMVLKVDLQCCRCYKKVKKVLCKIPQIQDQIYDEKANTVTIKVVCCSPEKIRDKICCKGGGSIKSIEIKPPPPPPKPKEPKPKEPEKKPEKPKESEKPKEPEKKPEKPKEPEKKPEKPKEPEKPKDPPPAPPAPAPAPKPPEPKAEKPKDPPPKPPEPATPPPMAYPCCMDCYCGRGGGPCHFGGPPLPPSPCYETYGRPVYDSWGGGGGYKYCYASRGDCFSDENPQACSIM